jgi:hypothetical protein
MVTRASLQLKHMVDRHQLPPRLRRTLQMRVSPRPLRRYSRVVEACAMMLPPMGTSCGGGKQEGAPMRVLTRGIAA